MKKASIFLSLVSGNVLFASAQAVTTQGAVNGTGLLSLLSLAQTIVARLVPFAVGLAVLAFFWFLVEFIWKGNGDATKRSEGLKGMGMSVLALFVMVSIWGLVGFLGSMFNIGQGGSVPIPGIPVPTN